MTTTVKTHFSLALLITCMAAGCGPKGPAAVHVSGQVLWDGKPLAKAQLLFIPKGANAKQGERLAASTDDEGRFKLSTSTKDDGALEGEYAVLVECRTNVPGPNNGGMVAENLLPRRYANPRAPLLSVKITRDTKELPPIQLTKN